MPVWGMPLFIVSGLLMLVGVYLVIKYRLYCTLKSPEREIAMELYRKRLTNNKMSSKEIEKYELYRRDTKLYEIGMRILLLIAPIHILILTLIDHQFSLLSGIYKMSAMLIVPTYIYSSVPVCFSWVFSVEKKTLLNTITIYLKKIKGNFLSDKEIKFYKDEQYTDKEFVIISFLFKIGVILILDVVLMYSNY